MKAGRAAKRGRRVLMYFNNHFSAKAVVNAVMIKSQLGEPIPGEYSEAFLNAYPHLRGVVQNYTEAWTLQPEYPANR